MQQWPISWASLAFASAVEIILLGSIAMAHVPFGNGIDRDSAHAILYSSISIPTSSANSKRSLTVWSGFSSAAPA